jgi:hypothetical protein
MTSDVSVVDHLEPRECLEQGRECGLSIEFADARTDWP